MITEATRTETANKAFLKVISTHRDNLSSKFAFLIHQSLINKVKSNSFPKPPQIERKYQKEVSTSGSCSSEDQNKQIDFVDKQASTIKKLLNILITYEDYLLSNENHTKETVKSVRSHNRYLLAYVINSKKDFSNLPRESIALSIILMNAEKIEMNKVKLLDFISNVLKITRISRISQLRKCRAYSVLTQFVKTTPLVTVVE